MSSLTVNYLGISMASPVIGASGTVGYGLELADYIDMKKNRRPLRQRPGAYPLERKRRRPRGRNHLGHAELHRP